MKKVSTILFALICTIQTFAQEILIKDVNIIPMSTNTVLTNKSVLIKNGKIAAIDDFSKLSKSKNTKIIDGKGKFLMPGLADMHVHLPELDKIEKLLLSNIAAGVTQIRVMNSSGSQLEWREKLKTISNINVPKFHFSHLVRRTDTFTLPQAENLMQQVKKDGLDFVKLLSLADEQTFENLNKAAAKYNVTLCGHYPVFQKDGQATMLSMEHVLKNNFKSIEHLAGYVWLQDKDQIDRALQLTKEYNIYNCPTLDWDVISGDLQYPDEYKNRITYQFLPKNVTKNWESNYAAAIGKAGGIDKVLASKAQSLLGFDLKLKVLKRLYDNDCLLLIGGDAGNDFQADGFNIYEEMMHWKTVGIDNYTILKSATITPAHFFNEQHLWGTVEVGKNAELILLSQNPLEDIKNITTIETTILGDKIYKNKEMMERL